MQILTLPPSFETKTRPSGSRFARFALVSFVLAALLRMTFFVAQQGISGDTMWHLAAGQWMLAHHAIARTDPFGALTHGRRWVTTEWSYEVALAVADKILGGLGLSLMAIVPAAFAIIFVVWRARRLGAIPVVAGLSAFVTLFYMEPGITERPQVASYAFVALAALLIESGIKDRRWLYALPLLAVIWANTHPSFPLLLAMIAVEIPWIPPSKRRFMFSILGVTFIATFVNAWGVTAWTHTFMQLLSPQITLNITEWMPPNFGVPVIMLLLGIPLALGLWQRCHLRPAVNILTVIMILATLHSERFIPYIALISFAPMAAVWKPKLGIFSTTIMAAMGIAVTVQMAVTMAPLGTIARSVPTRGLRMAAQVKGPVLTWYTWGGALILDGGHPVVDGRTDLYVGTGILSDYTKLVTLSSPPNPILSRLGTKAILFPRNVALTTYLANDKQWRLVAQGSTWVLYGRA